MGLWSKCQGRVSSGALFLIICSVFTYVFPSNASVYSGRSSHSKHNGSHKVYSLPTALKGILFIHGVIWLWHVQSYSGEKGETNFSRDQFSHRISWNNTITYMYLHIYYIYRRHSLDIALHFTCDWLPSAFFLKTITFLMVDLSHHLL